MSHVPRGLKRKLYTPHARVIRVFPNLFLKPKGLGKDAESLKSVRNGFINHQPLPLASKHGKGGDVQRVKDGPCIFGKKMKP
jgi:hypothetical protein